MVAGVANSNFLLAGVVGSRVDLAVGVISELSVAGQPGAGSFRLGDGLAGALTTLLGVALLRERVGSGGPRDPGTGQVHRGLRAACLLAFGVGTLVSALVPLTCAPSLGPCPASSAGPELVHDGISVLATTGAVVGGLELVWRLRRRLGTPLGVLAIVSILGSAGAGLVQVVSFLGGGSGGGGTSQRLQVLAVSLWILLEVCSGVSPTPAAETAPRTRARRAGPRVR